LQLKQNADTKFNALVSGTDFSRTCPNATALDLDATGVDVAEELTRAEDCHLSYYVDVADDRAFDFEVFDFVVAGKLDANVAGDVDALGANVVRELGTVAEFQRVLANDIAFERAFDDGIGANGLLTRKRGFQANPEATAQVNGLTCVGGE